ncbi:MAG: DUF523 domain-containing protein [Clostridia bacterium]|nr:DUF523 domain-containing protein [Clostridia bacterium]MBQ9252171.1 DUF523 domain-containing protein [Clostridia bacterium]
MNNSTKCPLLISACLLGTPCRYDGASKAMPAQTLELLQRSYHLIPVCPEELGGLPTPRMPSERVGDKVLMKTGKDVTEEYRKGAEISLRIALEAGCKIAVLKERSPSCGHGEIYDGTFSGTLVPGNGCTAELLLANGIQVLGESQVSEL